LITYCPVCNTQANSLYVYKYKLYLPRENFPSEGTYVISQWHGSPDPNILKDEQDCVAEISDVDRYELCKKGSCKQGKHVINWDF